MFLHVWKAIDHTIILALRYFWYNFVLLTGDYLPHTVLDCKVIDPQATTFSYVSVRLLLSTHSLTQAPVTQHLSKYGRCCVNPEEITLL